MGFRFQKRFSLSKLIRLNVSMSGVSVSLGVRGADINIRGDKVTGNIGIPNTGLSYRKRLDTPYVEPVEQAKIVPMQTEQKSSSLGTVFLVILILGFVFFLGYWAAK